MKSMIGPIICKSCSLIAMSMAVQTEALLFERHGVAQTEELFLGRVQRRYHANYHCGEKIAKLILFHFELIFAS